MSNVDWITSEQLGKARKIAKEYFDEFCEHDSYEQEWIEIEIDGKYFDLDCFDDNMDLPRTDVFCNIHPTYLNQDGWRETDGTEFIRLFTKGTITEDSDE